MFMVSTMGFMNSYLGTLNTFQGERPVFLREQANRMYGVLPYYAAKIIGDLPVFIVIPIEITLIVYYGVGFTMTWAQYFKFMLSLFCEI